VINITEGRIMHPSQKKSVHILVLTPRHKAYGEYDTLHLMD
jgi:hypothetical protein